MKIKRIVANLTAADMSQVDDFYRDLLGLELAMDHGWIRSYRGDQTMAVQLSLASEGGSGTPVPQLSIEVDDLDEMLDRVNSAGIAIEYGPCSEDWGLRRFYIRDPLGNLLNILQHE